METKISDILTALSSSDESERCYAIEDLQEVKNQEIVPYLVMGLKDRSVRVREAAVDALANVGGQAVAEATVALLNSEEVPLRNAAIEILEKLGCSALDVLVKYIHSSEVDVRKFSIDTVGKILSQSSESHPSILLNLVECLSDEDANIAGAAAEALGLAKDDMVIPFLVSHISGANQSSWLQSNIIAALTRISSQKSLEAIKEIDKSQLSNEAKTYLEMALNGEVL